MNKKSGRPPKPVTIRGVSYASHSEAAAAIGVCVSAITQAKNAGRLDHVGTGKRKQYRGKAIIDLRMTSDACAAFRDAMPRRSQRVELRMRSPAMKRSTAWK